MISESAIESKSPYFRRIKKELVNNSEYSKIEENLKT